MGCMDYPRSPGDNRDGPTPDRRPSVQEILAMREAMLCAVLSSLERNNTFDLVVQGADWEEAGVPVSSMLAWYKKHKKADRARKIREETARYREDARKTALAKLTESERKLLGL